MDLAVRTVATTGEIWAIVIVAVLVTAFLVAATAVAYSWQNRYHRRLRDAGMWQMATAPVIGPGPTVDAPGIVSTAAGRMGPDGPEIADTLAAREAVAPMHETAAGAVYVPPQRLRQAAPMPVSEAELAAEGQGEIPTRVDLPAQRGMREDEQAQSAMSRPGAADDPGRELCGSPAPLTLLPGYAPGAGRSTRAASAARCAPGVPKAIEAAFARLRYR